MGESDLESEHETLEGTSYGRVKVMELMQKLEQLKVESEHLTQEKAQLESDLKESEARVSKMALMIKDMDVDYNNVALENEELMDECDELESKEREYSDALRAKERELMEVMQELYEKDE
jgi:septal ring factor EnvC (AmiA/AmiB activator)